MSAAERDAVGVIRALTISLEKVGLQLNTVR